jgi:hypothetical protein
MKYLKLFLEKSEHTPPGSAYETYETTGGPPEKSGHSLGELPTKPTKPWLPRPAEIGSWPIRWRQRWGELSNQFEDQGIPFPESERRAYHQAKAEMEAS